MARAGGSVLLSIRQYVENQIHIITGLQGSPVDFTTPAGDPGLFGPQSAVWEVHADFTSMMLGGISALCLQMLDPKVLAGVWDHSRFRQDMQGRLSRTAQFISAVSYAGTEQAERCIDQVRRVHEHVHGYLPDGTPYDANDPELLRWVHHTQAYCFLQSHMRWRNARLAPEQQDRYVAQYSKVAVLLGADGLVMDAASLRALFAQAGPQLRVDARTREVATILMSSHTLFKGPKAWVARVFLLAALDMLPEWAQRCFEHRPSAISMWWRRKVVNSVAGVLRWATRNGSVHRARRRVANLA